MTGRWSWLSGWLRRVAPEPAHFTTSPSGGTGHCWYCAENVVEPSASLRLSSTASGSRVGMQLSPALRATVLLIAEADLYQSHLPQQSPAA